MIQSMTGFGRSIIQLHTKKITIELKSLNSKNLDFNTRMPSSYREKELELRNIIANKLIRGKVDFNLYIEITGEHSNNEINVDLVKYYIKQLQLIDTTIVNTETSDLLNIVMRMPDVMKTNRDEIDEEEYNAIKEAVVIALNKVEEFRTQEGEALEKDFKTRIHNISTLLEAVDNTDTERVAAVRNRLEKTIGELRDKVDENRFEQELIYYLEKLDITEEKTRLTNHLHYFSETLESNASNGKKLGFITQEIGREINTIGSKANHAPMQQIVVQMKDELEKIKEQMLNVL